jgi:hypothetical protein
MRIYVNTEAMAAKVVAVTTISTMKSQRAWRDFGDRPRLLNTGATFCLSFLYSGVESWLEGRRRNSQTEPTIWRHTNRVEIRDARSLN